MVLLSYTGSSQHSTYRPKVFIVILPLNKQKGSISSFHSTCVVLPCPGAVLIFRKQRGDQPGAQGTCGPAEDPWFQAPHKDTKTSKVGGKMELKS